MGSMQIKPEIGGPITLPAGTAWRLWLGLSLSILGILIALLSIGTEMILILLALAVLIVLVGLIQISFWSKLRQCWL